VDGGGGYPGLEAYLRFPTVAGQRRTSAFVLLGGHRLPREQPEHPGSWLPLPLSVVALEYRAEGSDGQATKILKTALTLILRL
jgi:hypothetical protein